MATLYGGLNFSNVPGREIREIIASRQNFPFAHATEAIKLGYFRKPITANMTAKKETGILGRTYTDLYDIKVVAPDFLYTPARLHDWYLLMKEPNNLRVKITYNDSHSEYINLVNDPSSDPTIPTGSSLAALNWKATVSNTESMIELTWTAGVTPLQAKWIGDNSGSGQTGGSGGTGSSMTALVNQRADRQIAGIKACTVGGAAGVFGGAGDIGILTSENCKVELSGVVQGDRKSYADLEFPSAIAVNVTMESMQCSLTKEYLQSVIDEYSDARLQVLCQSGMIFDFAVGALSINPDFGFGDEQGHLILNAVGEIPYNSNEVTPDLFDCGISNAKIIKVNALS